MSKNEFCMWGIAAILGVGCAILWLLQPISFPGDFWPPF